MRYVIHHDIRCPCQQIGTVDVLPGQGPTCLRLLCGLVLRGGMRPEMHEVVRLVRDEAIYRGLFKVTGTGG